MKKLIILLLITSSLKAQDTLKIPADQVRNIYIGLQLERQYSKLYPQCLKVADSLNSIIIEQELTLKQYIEEQYKIDEEIYDIYAEREKLLAKKPKKSLWWLWSGLGLLTGILISK